MESGELAEAARAAARHHVAKLIGRAGGLRKLVELASRVRPAEDSPSHDQLRGRDRESG